MEKSSIISRALILSAATAAYTACSGIREKEFVDYWNDRSCETYENAKAGERPKDTCIYTYGREDVVGTMSNATRQQLIGLERGFLITQGYAYATNAKGIIAKRDEIIGSGKGIYYLTEQRCPARRCVVFCYSDKQNACKITLMEKHGASIP